MRASERASGGERESGAAVEQPEDGHFVPDGRPPLSWCHSAVASVMADRIAGAAVAHTCHWLQLMKGV